jgi:hypothetical protein
MGKPNKEGLSAVFYFPVFYMYIRKSAMSPFALVGVEHDSRQGSLGDRANDYVVTRRTSLTRAPLLSDPGLDKHRPLSHEFERRAAVHLRAWARPTWPSPVAF